MVDKESKEAMRGGDFDAIAAESWRPEKLTQSENAPMNGCVDSGLSQPEPEPEPEPELERVKTMPPWKKGAQQMYAAAAARKKVAMEMGANELGR